MRYQLLEPPHPFDPRDLELSSLLELMREAPARPERCELEEEAANAVREIYPDALAMPVPLRVGSGQMLLLGILPDMHAPRDPHGKIRFVMLVHAVAESAADKKLIARSQQWSRHIWKPPVVLPKGEVMVEPVEIRATDLEAPSEIHAIVGTHRGADGKERLAIRCEVGGIAMSIVFRDPEIVICKPVTSSSDPDLTVTVEGGPLL